MKKILFAMIIELAVSASVPVKAKSTTKCGFSACTKSLEISILTSSPKLVESFQCYNAAFIVYDGEVREAKSKYWYCIAAAVRTRGGSYVACKTGVFKSQGLRDWLKKNLPRYAPLACATKAIAAGDLLISIAYRNI